MNVEQDLPIDTRIIKTKYKNYDLLARFWNGRYRGRVWKNKAKVADYSDESIDVILESLVQIVDQLREKQFNQRQSDSLNQSHFIDAWLNVIPSLDRGIISVLKMLARYKDHSAPMSRLLRISGFDSADDLLNKLHELDKMLQDELLLEFYPEQDELSPLCTVKIEGDVSPAMQRVLSINDDWANALLQADHALSTQTA